MKTIRGNIHHILIGLLIVILTSSIPNHAWSWGGYEVGQCIDANDWGDPKIDIPARLEQSRKNGLNLKYEITNSGRTYDHTNHTNPVKRQVVVAIDSGYKVKSLSENITIMLQQSRAEDAHCGGTLTNKEGTRECWFHSNGNDSRFTDESAEDEALDISNINECAYIEKNTDPTQTSSAIVPAICINESDATNYNTGYVNDDGLVQGCKIPCYLEDGVGLYMGLSPNNGTEDNIKATKHLGLTNQNQSIEYTPPEKLLADEPLGAYFPSAKIDDRLYFTIIDNYYSDNMGGYNIRLKNSSGVVRADPTTLEHIANFLTAPIENAMIVLYKGLINDSHYKDIIVAMLGLFIVIYGISLMAGLTQDVLGDGLIRIFKVSIVMVLFSNTALDSFLFFQQHLFDLLLDAGTEMASYILPTLGEGNLSTGNIFAIMDESVARMFSIETQSKILSVLFTNAGGILFLIVFYIILILFLIAVAKAFVQIIVGIYVASILIGLAPIFILFILFTQLKSILDEWFEQFIAYAVQIFITFVSLAMFTQIIEHFMEKNLGYRTCLVSICDWKVDQFACDLSSDIAKISWWMPVVGEHHLEGQDHKPFYDAPYLDVIQDNDKIQALRNTDDEGNLRPKNFLNTIEVLVFFGAVFFMYCFMNFAEQMAESLKGGASTKDLSSIWGARDALWGNIAGNKRNAQQLLDDQGRPIEGAVYRTTGRDLGVLGTVGRALKSGVKEAQSANKKLSPKSKKTAKSQTGASGKRKRNTGFHREWKKENFDETDLQETATKKLVNDEFHLEERLKQDFEKHKKVKKQNRDAITAHSHKSNLEGDTPQVGKDNIKGGKSTANLTGTAGTDTLTSTVERAIPSNIPGLQEEGRPEEMDEIGKALIGSPLGDNTYSRNVLLIAMELGMFLSDATMLSIDELINQIDTLSSKLDENSHRTTQREEIVPIEIDMPNTKPTAKAEDKSVGEKFRTTFSQEAARGQISHNDISSLMKTTRLSPSSYNLRLISRAIKLNYKFEDIMDLSQADLEKLLKK